MTRELRLRDAVRGVVLDPDDRVLLVRFELPHWAGWETPGGGVDAGESDDVALRRELAEETGLENFSGEVHVWNRTHFGAMGDWDGQVERYYLIHTEPFEPSPGLSWEQLNAEFVTAARWWRLDELQASDESFVPGDLPALVRTLVEGGPPDEPIDV